MRSMLHADVFLDSANLVDLRALFTEGVHKSEVFVAIATKDYLTRPWCLLELWEAHQANRPVLVMPITGRGYEKSVARKMIDDLENQLPIKALSDVLDHLRKQRADLAMLKASLIRQLGLEDEDSAERSERSETSARNENPARVRAGVAHTLRLSPKALIGSRELWGMDMARLPSLSKRDAEEEPRARALKSMGDLKWEPFGTDEQILAMARALIEHMAAATGRKLTWRDPLAESLGRRAPAKKGRTVKQLPMKTIPTSTSTTDDEPASPSTSRQTTGERSARMLSRRLKHSLSTLTRSITGAQHGRAGCSSEILILFDRTDARAASGARILQHDLQVHLEEMQAPWIVSLSYASEASLSLEIERVDVIVLLQTARVLRHATALVQLYEAAEGHAKPLRNVRLRDGGYDFEDARSLLRAPASALASDELQRLQTLLSHRNVSLARLSACLEDVVPMMISQTLDPEGGEGEIVAFLNHFWEHLPNLHGGISQAGVQRRKLLQKHSDQLLMRVRVVRALSGNRGNIELPTGSGDQSPGSNVRSSSRTSSRFGEHNAEEDEEQSGEVPIVSLPAVPKSAGTSPTERRIRVAVESATSSANPASNVWLGV